MTAGRSVPPSRLRVVLAFACIYLIWGSTYLAIRFAIESIPPFLMAGVRYVLAGATLYGYAAARGVAVRPTARQWLAAASLGALFFLAGNGGVAFAETRIPSGLTALLIAMVPIWIVILDWIRPGGLRPNVLTVAGVVVGFTGVWLLVGRRVAADGPALDLLAAGILVVTTCCWAAGTIVSKHLPHVRSHLQSGGMQMLAGGALLCLLGLATGEGARVHPAAITPRSWLAVGYLIVAGSLVAFSAYNWLLHVVPPARVGTYAFVNPAIAVFLGWSLGGETVGPSVLVAGAVIIAGVVMVIAARNATARAPAPSPGPPPGNFPPANRAPSGRA